MSKNLESRVQVLQRSLAYGHDPVVGEGAGGLKLA